MEVISLKICNDNPAAEIPRFKEMLIYYLWDIFNLPNVELASPQASQNIRNWIWNHRRLIFKNRTIFHWMAVNLFKPPYLWNDTNNDQYRRMTLLLNFFHIITQLFIYKVSFRDLIRLERHSDWSNTAQSIVCNALSFELATYNDVINSGIPINPNPLNNRITYWLRHPHHVEFRRQITDRFQRIHPFNTNPDTRAMVLNISEALTGPISKQHVIDFIEEVEGWNELH
jgi:hypothetical protein